MALGRREELGQGFLRGIAKDDTPKGSKKVVNNDKLQNVDIFLLLLTVLGCWWCGLWNRSPCSFERHGDAIYFTKGWQQDLNPTWMGKPARHGATAISQIQLVGQCILSYHARSSIIEKFRSIATGNAMQQNIATPSNPERIELREKTLRMLLSCSFDVDLV